VVETPKIVGGYPVTDISEYPFIVSVQLKPTLPSNHGSHFCGGTVLSKHFVITAAHCGVKFSAYLVQVVVGRLNLTTWDGATLG
jgi:secreted trypsin-like serine protease